MKKPMRRALFLLLSFCATVSAPALDASKRISQYAHSAYRVQDGDFSGAPNALAQTKDGYLWIGTDNGLVRFDGVRFVQWSAPQEKRLTGARIFALLGAHDGSLWIGTADGPARWTGNNLIKFSGVGAHINAFLEDRDGSIWMTRSRVDNRSGPLCHAIHDRIKCFSTGDGIPVPYAGPLVIDPAGTLWMGSAAVLGRWKAGSFKSYEPEELKKAEGLTGVNGLAFAQDGSLWVGIQRAGTGLGLERLVQDRLQPFVTNDFDGSKLEVTTLLLDHENSLWVGTARDGIYRIHGSAVDHFRHADGLSGDSVNCFFQDAEGTLWVATSRGIDSFHDLRVTTYSSAEGLSSDRAGAILAGHDGTIWIANSGALDSIHNGKVSSIRRENGLPGTRVTALLEDHAGKLWIGIDNGLWTYDRGRFNPIRNQGKPLGTTIDLTEDANGNIWAVVIGNSNAIVRIAGNQVRELVPPSKVDAFSFVSDGPGLWLTLTNRKLGHYQDGRLAVYSTKTSRDSGGVRSVYLDVDGALWGVTENGLIRWKNGVVKSLGAQNGYGCERTYALLLDKEQSLWSYTSCGLFRITRQELDRWWKDPDALVAVRRFDVFDGVQPGIASFWPRATRSPDGLLWFANDNVVQMIDPSRLVSHSIPPPVAIESVVADRKTYAVAGQLRLPPLTRDLEVDYTGLSLITPQKMRFRYRLEGRDTSWQEAGTRRQAFYSDLHPGRYQFRVTAANADGVWNETGAALEFVVLPAFYQTKGFSLFTFLAAIALIWLFYQIRVRQVTVALQERFEERIAERTRLARELHDTLLQTLQGSKLFADTTLHQPSDAARMRDAIVSLSGWLERAIAEVRASLNSLRTSTSHQDNLVEALRRAAENFRRDPAVQFDFAVTGLADGAEPAMHSVAREEVYRIGYEAILNACRHSGATALEVKVSYLPDFHLCIRDNGRGMDSAIAAHGKEGHFGLQGMRERARRIQAVLTIVSEVNAGTKVDLLVPAKAAFPQPNGWAALGKRVRMVINTFDEKTG